MIRHDFRRTAVRNMVTGDIPTFGHDGHGPSDLLGVRSMPHREPGGPSGCGSTPLDARGGTTTGTTVTPDVKIKQSH